MKRYRASSSRSRAKTIALEGLNYPFSLAVIAALLNEAKLSSEKSHLVKTGNTGDPDSRSSQSQA